MKQSTLSDTTTAKELHDLIRSKFVLKDCKVLVVKTAPLSASICDTIGKSNRWPVKSALIGDDLLPTTFHVICLHENDLICAGFWPMCNFFKNKVKQEGFEIRVDYTSHESIKNVIEVEDGEVYIQTSSCSENGISGPSPLQRYYPQTILDSYHESSWEPQPGQLIQTMDGSPALFIGGSAGASGVFGNILLGETISQVPLFTLSPYVEE